MMTSKMAAKNAEVRQIVSFGLDCYCNIFFIHNLGQRIHFPKEDTIWPFWGTYVKKVHL